MKGLLSVYDFSKLKEQLSEWNILLSDTQVAALGTYYKLLTDKNKLMNLTSITDFEAVCTKHFLDSAAMLKKETAGFLFDSAAAPSIKLIDIGSGAGFPGMVLKILRSEMDITLLDALQKRVDFLDAVSVALSLGVKVIHDRAEELGKADAPHSLRNSFDIVCSRAVADMSVLTEYALPLLRINGVFCAYKSAENEEEVSQALRAANALGGEIICVDDYVLPLSDIKRRLILIRKTSETHAKYPRREAAIKRKPL